MFVMFRLIRATLRTALLIVSVVNSGRFVSDQFSKLSFVERNDFLRVLDASTILFCWELYSLMLFAYRSPTVLDRSLWSFD